MATLTLDPTGSVGNDISGKDIFEDPATKLRATNDIHDRKDGSSYDHDEQRWSGTEANEIKSWIQYVSQNILSGGIASVQIRNETGVTLNAGTLVYISGYSSGESRWLVAKAQADAPGTRARLVIESSLATAANGIGYKVASIGSLNTSAGSVNDPVYLSDSTAGEWTLTAPASNPAQVVGRIKVDHASTGEVEFDFTDPLPQELHQGAAPYFSGLLFPANNTHDIGTSTVGARNIFAQTRFQMGATGSGGSAGSPGFNIARTGQGCGIYSSTDDQLDFATNDTQRGFFRSSGELSLLNLTATRLLSGDGSKNVVSTDLSSWVTGTANQVTVTDDADGTITLSLPQSINTGAVPEFNRLTLNQTTGTAPMVISSTTLVSNLNADLLDGNEASAFALSSHNHAASDITSGTLDVDHGGTGQSTYTNGQLLIGNTTGNTLAKATLTGTSNQVTVSNGAGSITLSVPQDIHTGATPTFEGVIASVAGDPKFQLTVQSGTDWYMGADDSDSDRFLIGTGTTVGSNRKLGHTGTDLNAEVAASGSAGTPLHINGTGSWATITGFTSSRRYKRNERPYKRPKANPIYKLDIIEYETDGPSIKTGKQHEVTEFGLIAEDTFEIEPSLVLLDQEDRPNAINDTHLRYYMLMAIQDLKAELKSLSR